MDLLGSRLWCMLSQLVSFTAQETTLCNSSQLTTLNSCVIYAKRNR